MLPALPLFLRPLQSTFQRPDGGHSRPAGPVRRGSGALAPALLAALLGWAVPAQADVYAEVLGPLEAGQAALARQRAELHLQQHPRDVQMQLILAQVQDAQGQLPQALATLQTLARAYPELPEVHNNLAVLQARQGELQDALQSLHQALRTRPDYTVALENLGDVHTRLAQQAYERARQSAAAVPRLARKLELTRQTLDAKP